MMGMGIPARVNTSTTNNYAGIGLDVGKPKPKAPKLKKAAKKKVRKLNFNKSKPMPEEE